MKKILIIDDDIDIGNMLEETLIKEGYETSRAYSGTEAILLLEHAKDVYKRQIAHICPLMIKAT